MDQSMVHQVLEAARMFVTEGLGEGRSAHGYSIIVGNAHEILSGEGTDPAKRDTRLYKYGDFRTYVDRRNQDLRIGDCLSERWRIF